MWIQQHTVPSYWSLMFLWNFAGTVKPCKQTKVKIWSWKLIWIWSAAAYIKSKKFHRINDENVSCDFIFCFRFSSAVALCKSKIVRVILSVFRQNLTLIFMQALYICNFVLDNLVTWVHIIRRKCVYFGIATENSQE